MFCRVLLTSILLRKTKSDDYIDRVFGDTRGSAKSLDGILLFVKKYGSSFIFEEQEGAREVGERRLRRMLRLLEG